MNGHRAWSWLPVFVFVLALGWTGYTAWQLRQARLDEHALRARFEELLEEVRTTPKRAEPLEPERLPDVYSELIDRALELGLEVREINPELEEGLIVLEGGFEEAYAMLEAVRASSLPVWVKGLEIARLDDEGKRLAVSYMVGVRLALEEEFGGEGLEGEGPL